MAVLFSLCFTNRLAECLLELSKLVLKLKDNSKISRLVETSCKSFSQIIKRTTDSVMHFGRGGSINTL